nr:VanZ family protein [Roseovarius autotrophicus]
MEIWRAAPLLWVTFFFVFLTQHPFPDLQTLDCPVPSATPQLKLFRFWDTVAVLREQDRTLIGWLGNRTIAATLMNFLICLFIGLALSRHVRRFLIAMLFGATLSLTVELTQLTGIWGLYPCAYRQFNVDDLFMNVLGIIAGFVIGRGILTRKLLPYPEG